MNRPPLTQLDAFEAALLAELKSAAHDTATGAPKAATAPLGRFDRRPRRRWYLPVAAVAAIVMLIVLLVPSLVPEPAYAVTAGNNGEVTVRVTRLEGADGLEHALREHGIPADITYLPADKKCAPGRYTAVPTPGLMLGVGVDMFEVTIPSGSVGQDDTFVLSAAVVPVPNGFRATVDFDIARGAVAPCRVVDAS